MAKIYADTPDDSFFVFDSSKEFNESGCIHILMIKSLSQAFEHTLSLNESMDLIHAIQLAIDTHNAKYDMQ